MTRTGRHVVVRGRVQGVSFRWATAQAARHLGLGGWVRNLADGRVEAWIEGEDERVESLLAWLAVGPPVARVDDVVVREVPPEELAEFEIRPTARG